MGYQLWTSPITGYRRRGTRLSEIRALFASGIQARAILEPLQCCPAEAPAQDMKLLLARRSFDVAGVQERQNGPVVGYVESVRLIDGRTRQYIVPFHDEQLVSDATPLQQLLAALKTQERVFA